MIQTENTPNPDSLKFLSEKTLSSIGTEEFKKEKEKLNKAINEIKSNNVKVVIGPITNEEFEIAEKHNDLVFVSPSNINSNKSIKRQFHRKLH